MERGIEGGAARWLCVLGLGIGLACMGALSIAGESPAPAVAITFDDLPFAAEGDAADDPVTARAVNSAILAALERHAVPAIGFVTERSAQRLGPVSRELLAGWNRSPHELGNHGFAHADANALDLDGIRREIVRGEETIGPMVAAAGRTLRFFRFPMNHVGETDDKREAIEALLTGHGYVLAAATIDTSDYLFDRAYGRALDAGDTVMRRRIEDAYLDHSRGQIVYYAGLNRQVLGHDVPAIMLLHVNRLNAATMDRLLDVFLSLGYRFVPLSEAQADPAYATPPAFSTSYGPMWGYRWARERGIWIDGRQEPVPPGWIKLYADVGSTN